MVISTKKIKMTTKGSTYIIIGLLILLSPIGFKELLEVYFGDWGKWIAFLGYPIGGFLILKGREKLGLKNKWFGDNKNQL
ncbi:MAG: hypothetical protein H8D87_03290 [Deltaproteobacteria bacterium]|uniref:hypothetical protein n=1 Tax=Desulfobacula sp. TaxID=2593537 RepID=UPI0019BE43A9|nr:hypothetical protein [Candidatus Desulfobacula maris]MBL6993006.1 hypothetical protein [Desulfobacula sp.]